MSNQGISVEGNEGLDAMDKSILRILALYEGLDIVELWYEIGEDDTSPEEITREEVLSRLEFLGGEGLVKCVKGPQNHPKWTIDRKGCWGKPNGSCE